MSPDLMYSNPTLVTNGDHNSKLRLVWENLCVDAELPPPSCFQRMKACCTGNSENIQEKSIRPVLKNGIHQFSNQFNSVNIMFKVTPRFSVFQ